VETIDILSKFNSKSSFTVTILSLFATIVFAQEGDVVLKNCTSVQLAMRDVIAYSGV